MEILRYTAFSGDPAGGNPAGIVLDATDLDDATMQRIAADIGYSETAFLIPTGPTTAQVRYFAPIAEVPFCGHATIASAVARAERVGVGPLTLDSAVGPIEVSTTEQRRTGIVATLVSVPPSVTELTAARRHRRRLLAALRLTAETSTRAADQGVVLRESPPDRRRAARGAGPARSRPAGAGHVDGRKGLAAQRLPSSPGSVTTNSRHATRSRRAGCGRIRPPGRPPPRSAGTCGRSASSIRRPVPSAGGIMRSGQGRSRRDRSRAC